MMQSSTRQPVRQRSNVRERQRETESLVEMKCYEFHNCEFAGTAAEVEDVASSHPLAPGGAFLTLPMFYLEGMLSSSGFQRIKRGLCVCFVVLVLGHSFLVSPE
jgi:hypothetical protein